MNLSILIGDFALTFDKKLDEIASKYSANCTESVIVDAIKYSLFSGGKRLRPFLLSSIGKMFCVPDDVLLHVGCAIEMVHSYSLVHDDLPAMDNDDFRRGKPTCHRKFGEGVAILAGDALLTMAFAVLSDQDLKIDSDRKIRIINVLSDVAGINGLIQGQVADVLAMKPGISHDSIDIDKIKSIHLNKTAKMFVASCHIAAILGIASDIESYKVLEYGQNLGLLFQVIDDMEDSGVSNRVESVNIANIFGTQKAKKIAESLARDAKISILNFPKNDILIGLIDNLLRKI